MIRPLCVAFLARFTLYDLTTILGSDFPLISMRACESLINIQVLFLSYFDITVRIIHINLVSAYKGTSAWSLCPVGSELWSTGDRAAFFIIVFQESCDIKVDIFSCCRHSFVSPNQPLGKGPSMIQYSLVSGRKGTPAPILPFSGPHLSAHRGLDCSWDFYTVFFPGNIECSPYIYKEDFEDVGHIPSIYRYPNPLCHKM